MLELISATRADKSAFWSKSPLGISLQRLRTEKAWEPHIALQNTKGLAEVYNARITGRGPNDVLVFVHDDIWIDDHFLIQRVLEGLDRYDVIGVAGNRRCRPQQPAWCFRNDKLEWDVGKYLSGSVAHGPRPFGKVAYFGPTPADCDLLDGVLLAARRSTLRSKGVLFDPMFQFHCYDIDFCRTARAKGLSMGTWPIAITHCSGGNFGDAWKDSVQLYRKKWGAEAGIR